MSNVTTLQSNYNIITNNNLTIDDILETINNLPEAGSGEEDLTTVLESHDTAITTQETIIDQIAAALEGKASGSSSGGLQEENVDVTLSITSPLSSYIPDVSYLTYENGKFVPIFIDVSINNYSATLSVAKGSFITLQKSYSTSQMNYDSVTGDIETFVDTSSSPYNQTIMAQINGSGALSISSSSFSGGGNND